MDNLPKQITRTMHIVYDPAFYLEDSERLSISEHDPADLSSSSRFSIGTVVVTVDVPQQVDVVGAQVANLRARRDAVVAEMTAKTAEIDRQTQELLALPAPSVEAGQ